MNTIRVLYRAIRLDLKRWLNARRRAKHYVRMPPVADPRDTQAYFNCAVRK